MEGPERAGFVAEKLSSVCQCSCSSLRTRSCSWRPRAAAPELPKAAAAARMPPGRPQGPRRLAGPVSVAFVLFVVSPVVVVVFGLSGACQAEKAMFVGVPVACCVEANAS